MELDVVITQNVDTMKYSIAMRMNKILLHTVVHEYQKDIEGVQSRRSQTQKEYSLYEFT